MLTLYAITEAGAPVAPPLLRVEAGGVAAVVEETDAAPAPTPEALWAHEHAVEGVMASRPVLPVRFGTRFRDHAALVALLEARGEGFQSLLEHVRGCVEIGVRVLWNDQAPEPPDEPPPAPPADTGPGRQYLLRRLAATGATQARQGRADALARSLLDALTPGTRDVRTHVLQTPRQLLNAALLVPNEAVELIRSRAEALASQHPHLRVLCTGPWPPYSFTDPA